MYRQYSTTNLVIVLATVFSVSVMCATAGLAQHHHGHGAHSGAHAAHDQHGTAEAKATDTPTSTKTPHGGQVSAAGPYRFEVVYQPHETRVYLYDTNSQPISAQSVEGKVALKVRSYDKTYRYALAHAPKATSPDYLVVPINVSKIKDGDMQAIFEMTNLPNLGQPEAMFTQTFALSKATPGSVWTCPMHPKVKAAMPGKCPICGMDLIQLNKGKDAASSESSQSHSPEASHTAASETTASHSPGASTSHSSGSGGSHSSGHAHAKGCKHHCK